MRYRKRHGQNENDRRKELFKKKVHQKHVAQKERERERKRIKEREKERE